MLANSSSSGIRTSFARRAMRACQACRRGACAVRLIVGSGPSASPSRAKPLSLVAEEKSAASTGPAGIAERSQRSFREPRAHLGACCGEDDVQNGPLRLRPPEETLSPTGRELKPQGDMSQDEPRGHGKQDVEGVPNAILAQLTGSSGSLPSSTPGVDEPALRATEPPCHRNNLSETAPKLSKPAHRWPSAFSRRAKVSHSCSRQHQWPSCFLKRLCLHCEPSTW